MVSNPRNPLEAQKALPIAKEAAPRERSGGTPKPRKRVQFGPPSDGPEPVVEKVKLGKPAKRKREKLKADPALVAKARELRDRYLEQFNSGLVLPNGKYEVSRQISTQVESSPRQITHNLAA